MKRWLDGNFWSRSFDDLFIRQITSFHKAITNRVLPTFDNIEKEADDLAEAEYKRLGNLPASGEETWDMGDAAEIAQEAGFAYYEAATKARQSIINMSVASLYHILEQQLLLFHRRQVLNKTEGDDIKKINFKELIKRLLDDGIDITSLKTWVKIDELRLSANSVKHAEGDSSKRLKQLRPDVFENPYLKGKVWGQMLSIDNVYMPLAGEDIYFSIDDLNNYKSNIISFWQDFGISIKEHSDKQIKDKKT